ncbi:MAG: ATP-binding cassette domain-containing protein [Halorhabdus sp.]
MSEQILDVEGLSKSFGAVSATDDITLSFDCGEFHGVIGPNGSGKTTLFDLLTGFYEPDSGVVKFEGRDITGMSPDRIARQGLVRTFQIASPFGGLTVRENLLAVHTGGHQSGIRVSSARRERADEVLEVLDLAGVADQTANNVSGGQQKLLELGRVMMLEPKCLLLDEPTAGVNPTTQDRVLATLRKMNASGTTILLIEHDMDVLENVTDQITVLHNGRVLTQGTPGEVTDDERVRDVYIGRETAENSDLAASTGRSEEGSTKEVPNPETDFQTEPAAGSASESEAVTSLTPTTGRDDDRLVTKDVVAGYGNKIVLNGVSFRSHDGVTCIFGPNGSGKSTLLKTIAGIVPVQSGTIEYGGRSITGLTPHEIVEEGITAVSQRDPVFRTLTVRENLLLGATTVTDDDVAKDRMDEVLDVFPVLEASISEPARSLSGGQQAMLGIARAMMTGADIYLLDEPLSGLAPSVVGNVLEVIETLVHSGTQVIMVEQHVRAALQVADHVYILSQGELRSDGKPAEFEHEDELMNIYLGLD